MTVVLAPPAWFASLVGRPISLAMTGLTISQIPRIRAVAVSRVAAALADAYQVVYDSLADPSCGYGEEAAASGALKHTPEAIRTILGIV